MSGHAADALELADDFEEQIKRQRGRVIVLDMSRDDADLLLSALREGSWCDYE